MLILLIDPELSIYADAKRIILDNGADVIISNPSVIDLCSSKAKTARFFSETGLPFLETLEIGEIKGDQDIHFPAILKPCIGSGGKDVYLVENMQEVEALSNRIDNPIIQEKAEGQEITLDCLTDFSGSPVRIVARERLEIRSGESSKGRTFKDNNLLRLVFELLSNLHAIGPVTVQCFRSNGKYVFSEINPRFGGGYPLSHAAGANFPALLIQMYNRQQIKGQLDEYEENLYFCRYDDAFYFRKDEGQSKFPSPDGKD